MGLFDNVQSAVNRGAAAAERTSRSAKLKMQLNESLKRRQSLAAQLGASLYETTKEDDGLRAGRESLYDGIAEIDRQRESITSELRQIEAQAALLEEAGRVYRCHACGVPVHATDLFCSGCGTPVAEIKAAVGTMPSETGSPSASCPSCHGGVA